MDLETLAVPASQPEALRCCCGETDCVFLKHNCLVLGSVERDVHSAAKLGQALLVRHEAYMASAERERLKMQSRIEQLESEEEWLQEQNAQTMAENHALLEQLGSLNNSVADSETHTRRLEELLQGSEKAIRRLEATEVEAAQMATQITTWEAERATLHDDVVMMEAEARSAMQRWRKAERGISDLQEKVERIEGEARDERERHAKVVSRMKRQYAMEKDLHTAAGRLKGATTVKAIGEGQREEGSVISRFVRDLLQDNANLQLGIAELRGLLMDSNDEIQLLREQLVIHQPAEDGYGSAANTLRAQLSSTEMEPSSPKPQLSPEALPDSRSDQFQDVHIHHHYHLTRPPTEPKKPKKKGHNLAPNNLLFTPPRPFSPSFPSLSSPRHWKSLHAQAALSVKGSMSTAPSRRMSVFSDYPSGFAPSSVPSSPFSNHRGSVIDRGGYYDTSYSTSPVTNADPTSPAWAQDTKKASGTSRRKLSTPGPIFLAGRPEDNQNYAGTFEDGDHGTWRLANDGSLRKTAPKGNSYVTARVVVSQEDLMNISGDSDDVVPSMPLAPSLDVSSFVIGPNPCLGQASSLESITSLSGSGLDIHTLKVRPSQLTVGPLGAVTADTGISAVTARPTIARAVAGGKRGSVVIRDNLLNLPNLWIGGRSVSDTTMASPAIRTSESQQRSSSSANSNLGRLVNWRPWGNTSKADADADADDALGAPTSDGSRSLSPKPVTTSSSLDASIVDMNTNDNEVTKKRPPQKEVAFSARDFGINQPGAIPGFQEYLAYHQRRGLPTKVVPDVVDTEALREGLEED